MGRTSKRARKIRQRSEFDLAQLARALQPPRATSSAYAWDLPSIVAARNAQMRGQFRLPVRLAESTRTDPALFLAQNSRVAPQRIVRPEIKAAGGARGAPIAGEALALYGAEGIGVTVETLSEITATLANHGLAIGKNEHVVRDDGSRVDLCMTQWPLEHVRWDDSSQSLKTLVDGGPEETIVHGDGRWVVFSIHDTKPWKWGAILPAALVWASHAFANRDWSKSSVAHGSAKVVGELPAGVALQMLTEAGAETLSPEASAMLQLLLAIVSDDSPVGIRPAGSKTDFLTNTSTAWQIFSELARNGEKHAARIYLGTDAILGAQGGAPGVDIAKLLGVSVTIVQGDFGAIGRGLRTGVIEPWAAINFGDSRLAPSRVYMIPDQDADAARESLAKRTEAFYAEIEKARSSGFVITQEFVNAVAERYGVQAPTLPEEAKKAPAIVLAPTDIARVVTVNEARASAGAGPLLRADGSPDPDGQLTVDVFSAKKSAEAAPPPAQTPAA